LEYNETVHKLFVDFKKAYDSVRSEVLYNILLKLVRLIKMCLNETYSKLRSSKHFSDNIPIQNGLKRGDASSPLLFNFTYIIGNVQENQAGPKLNGTHQLQVYAEDVNLLGDNIDTTNNKPETLIDAIEEVVREAVSSPECRENYDIKRANRFFENMAQFK
jgi:hypothetical protein